MSHPPIALMTDFGQSDPFVGMMKGVIAGIAPWARVIDLTHGIRPQEVLQGAFVLYRSFFYFPKGTVFCAVVDPGVGTDRRAIAIRTRRYCFVGPDNGLVWPAAHADGIEAWVSLENPEFFLDRVSATFHGRDIFAPVSAHLSMGRPLENFGPAPASPVILDIPRPRHLAGEIELTVLDRDRYGNLTLNLRNAEFGPYARDGFSLVFKGEKITQWAEAYGRARNNIPFVIAGSSGFIEVAVKNGNASGRLGADLQDCFLLRPAKAEDPDGTGAAAP